jgi:hypothetical protein
MNIIDDAIKTMIWPENVYKLTFNNCTDIDDFNWPKSLSMLWINSTQSFVSIKWPETLHTLQINTRANFPESLHTLIYSADEFHRLHDMNNYILPMGLHTLEFSSYFDFEISEKIDMSHINTLIFGCKYNQKLPVNLNLLEKLTFREIFSYYNKCINVSMPLIKYLKFGDRYNNVLYSWSMLHTLFLGRDFNQELNISLPQLHTLIFPAYSMFSHDISKLQAPLINVLTLGIQFNNDITNINFPTLHMLTLGYSFNHNIDNVNFQSLITLTFGSKFNQDISHAKFPVLETIYDHSCKITEKSCNFPNTLYKIIHIAPVDIKTTIYTRNTGQKTKAAR